jgi:hypothetical protein
MSESLQLESAPDETLARLWKLSREFFSPGISAFDALVAAKILKPSHESFETSSRAQATAVLRPVYTWLALEHAIEERGFRQAEEPQIVTLGGEDEQGMWDLWRKRAGAPMLASIYVPKLDSPTTDLSLWNRRELLRDNPFAEHDLESFTLQASGGGPAGERLLEWIFTSAVQLPAAASNRLIEGLIYDQTPIDTWGPALDALRHDPVGVARAIAQAVSRWFYAD